MLKQTDNDCKSSNSNVVAVKFGVDGKRSRVYSDGDKLYLNTEAEGKGVASVTLYNTLGTRLFTKDSQVERGNNTLTFDFAYPAGAYILKLQVDGKTETLKFLR